jgi:hypothetical protein
VGKKGSGTHGRTLGVAGIVEGKLRGGSSTKDRASTVRFRGRRWCSGDRCAGRRRGIGQGASRGDVVLMVLLAREEKGWNFGSTRNRMVTGSEIAGAVSPGLRAREEDEERVRKGQ